MAAIVLRAESSLGPTLAADSLGRKHTIHMIQKAALGGEAGASKKQETGVQRGSEGELGLIPTRRKEDEEWAWDEDPFRVN